MKSKSILLFSLLCFLFTVSCSTDDSPSNNDSNNDNIDDNVEVEKIHNGPVVLDTQAQLNAFAAKKYTTIIGGLYIRKEAINSTEGLESIKKIYGNIYIGTTSLTNIEGLSNVNIYPKPNATENELLSLNIVGNSLLQNLDGFQGISNTLGSLMIFNNPKLQNIDGLSNLSNVTYNIEITHSESLENLNGLSGISNPVCMLNISLNSALVDVSGLSNLPSISSETHSNFSSFKFSFNPVINSLNGLTSLKKIDGDLFITDNAMLENIDGLSNLETCREVYIDTNTNLLHLNGLNKLSKITKKLIIKKNNSLNDFCGLDLLISNDTSFQYEVSNNLYNPTLEDLQEENCKI